jgi:hypothetical protein
MAFCIASMQARGMGGAALSEKRSKQQDMAAALKAGQHFVDLPCLIGHNGNKRCEWALRLALFKKKKGAEA